MFGILGMLVRKFTELFLPMSEMGFSSLHILIVDSCFHEILDITILGMRA
jgi:hypothetical protein